MFTAQQYFDRSHESLIGIQPNELTDFIEPKLEYAMSLDGLSQRLHDGDTLKVKMGIDPTGPDIHLGHIVPVRVLDLFNRAGHHVDLIFGDFTAKIGDPSGRSDGRKVISDEDIATNVATYQSQIQGYFDTNRENVSVHRNTDWLGKLALPEAFEYLQMVNLTEATQRKDFRARMEQGASVSLAEAMYGTLQGIDSVHLHSDVEIGGIDQLLNVQQARNVQRSRGQFPEEILLTPIIEGTSGDGRKMSKSYGNYIPAKADSDEIFGKLMSIPDSHIAPYTIAFAPVLKQDVERLRQASQAGPMEAKKQLATYMVALASGNMEIGLAARDSFERRFARHEIADSDTAVISTAHGATLMTALLSSGQYTSNSALRRLAQGGGIKVGGTKISEAALQQPVAPGSVISVGKRTHFKVEQADVL